jgi:predicted MFS family arabinose efflux permease
VGRRYPSGSVPSEPATEQPPVSASLPRALAAFEVPYYARLWASGGLWNLTRWLGVFLASYLVNDLTHSPLLVQLVGAAFFAPMFFAGALGGVISDRFDRRRTILGQLLILIPIAALLGVLVTADTVRVWMVYPFMLVVGLGGVIDMTSRRALVWDFVGEARVTNAMALESLSMTTGNMLGTLTGGAVIDALGIGTAFFLIPLCYTGSFLFLLGVPVPHRPRVHPHAHGSVIADILAGFRLARRDRVLISILGTTVLMNGFYFTYTPMVPVFADRLEVSAFWTGVLASASGLGSLIASVVIASRAPGGRGLIYVGGSTVALSFLFVFALAGWYSVALLTLLCSGMGVAGFTTMQSVLVMSTSTPEMRGRAMGILSMAIGTLPFAMAALGVVAQGAGAQAAVLISAALGIGAMVLWNVWRPEARRLS